MNGPLQISCGIICHDKLHVTRDRSLKNKGSINPKKKTII